MGWITDHIVWSASIKVVWSWYTRSIDLGSSVDIAYLSTFDTVTTWSNIFIQRGRIVRTNMGFLNWSLTTGVDTLKSLYSVVEVTTCGLCGNCYVICDVRSRDTFIFNFDFLDYLWLGRGFDSRVHRYVSGLDVFIYKYISIYKKVSLSIVSFLSVV